MCARRILAHILRCAPHLDSQMVLFHQSMSLMGTGRQGALEVPLTTTVKVRTAVSHATEAALGEGRARGRGQMTQVLINRLNHSGHVNVTGTAALLSYMSPEFA